MSNMLSDGVDYLRGVLQENAATAVVYRRGVSEIEISNAVIGQTRTEASDGDGITLESQERDFLIEAELIDFGAGAVDPASFDQIEEVVTGKIYEVKPLGGDKCFRPSDPYGKMLRIHTQLMGAA